MLPASARGLALVISARATANLSPTLLKSSHGRRKARSLIVHGAANQVFLEHALYFLLEHAQGTLK